MNEAELLFTHILNCNRISLYLDKDLKLDKDKSRLVSKILKKRMLGEPLPYILGKIEFMGLEFKITPDVFIPRPVTEILVETVIKLVRGCTQQARPLNILDIGTGSGCIAVSLTKFLSDIKITAIDISGAAIKLARANARLNKVADKISFIHSNLFTPLEIPKYSDGKARFLMGITDYGLRITDYDIIISNPPYIPNADIEKLQAELRYEPRTALDGGRDGLDFYRKIIKDSPAYLKEGGFLAMEMGFDQAETIKNIFQNSVNLAVTEIVRDYSNIDRVIVGKNTTHYTLV